MRAGAAAVARVAAGLDSLVFMPRLNHIRPYLIIWFVVRRALGALLTLFVLAPFPALCFACVSDVCPTRTTATAHDERNEPESSKEMSPCHAEPGQSESWKAPKSAAYELTAMTPECCATAAETPSRAPAVLAKELSSPALTVSDQEAGRTVLPGRSPADAARGGPPPEAPRPLYTLHSTLLI